MFTSPKSVRKIEHVQERALRILLNDYTSDYETLLDMSKKSTVFTSIHSTLAREVYKTLNDCNPAVDIKIGPLRQKHHQFKYLWGIQGVIGYDVNTIV